MFNPEIEFALKPAPRVQKRKTLTDEVMETITEEWETASQIGRRVSQGSVAVAGSLRHLRQQGLVEYIAEHKGRTGRYRLAKR